MSNPQWRKNALERVRETKAKITSLMREIESDLAEVRSLRDPMLSAEGLRAKRAEMQEQLRAKHAHAIEALKEDLAFDVETLTDFVDKTRPRVAEDAASLMRVQMRWDQVRMRLEAGAPITKVIAEAGVEELLALREWAPTWVSAQSESSRPRGVDGHEFEGPDPSGLLRTIDERLAEESGGEYAEGFTAAREAEGVAAYAAPMLAHLGVLAAGGKSDAMYAAIEARLAQQEVSAPLETAADAAYADTDGDAA